MRSSRRCIPSSVSAFVPRTFSSAASDVVEQMISYARQHYRDSPDQVDDILKSGLSRETAGPPAARLWLARCDLAVEQSEWRHAAEHAQEALVALEGPSTAASASSLIARQAGPLAIYSRVSAHLALGLPVEASETRWDGQPISNGNGSVFPFILAARLASAESGTTQWPEGAKEGERDIRAHQVDYFDEPDLGLAALSRERAAHALTQAWTQSAYTLSQDDAKHMRSLVDQAVQVAQTAASASPVQGGGSSGVLESPMRLAEASADALLLAAQLAAMETRWQESEVALGDALSTLSAVSADNHPRLALPLILLGWVYSRSARVTLAEGLYREAAKLLALEPSSDGVNSIDNGIEHRLVHPSTSALLAWRYAQLLTALPKRTIEATRWHDLAAALARKAGITEPLLDVLGPLDLLKGTAKGVAFPGVLLSVPHRRAFPLGL